MVVLRAFPALVYAFGTYVNFSHDVLFLDIGKDVFDILPLVLRLPEKFEGLAMRASVAKAIERKGEENV